MVGSRSVDRVVEAGMALGIEVVVTTFPDATRTAQQAADAIGCEVAAIVKSLVFDVDGQPVVALVPGDRRLNVSALAEVAGAAIVERASLDAVRAATGYVAGGTPPFGHITGLPVYADVDIRRHDPVWAAAGTPHTVFPISIEDLARATDAIWAAIAE